jgi:hypothetical protein
MKLYLAPIALFQEKAVSNGAKLAGWAALTHALAIPEPVRRPSCDFCRAPKGDGKACQDRRTPGSRAVLSIAYRAKTFPRYHQEDQLSRRILHGVRTAQLNEPGQRHSRLAPPSLHYRSRLAAGRCNQDFDHSSTPVGTECARPGDSQLVRRTWVNLISLEIGLSEYRRPILKSSHWKERSKFTWGKLFKRGHYANRDVDRLFAAAYGYASHRRHAAVVPPPCNRELAA